MTSENDRVIKFNQYLKSDKVPHIIYAESTLNLKNRWMCI